MSESRDNEIRSIGITRRVGQMPTAQIEYADPAGRYDPALGSQWLPDETDLTLQVGWSGALTTAMRGLVSANSINYDNVTTEARARVTVGSAFRRLIDRPVNTETFDGRAKDIITTLSQQH